MIQELYLAKMHGSVAVRYNAIKQQWRKMNINIGLNIPVMLHGTYLGKIINGKPEGYGILVYVHGNNAYMTTYKGRWKNGRFNGRGSLETIFSSHSYRFNGRFKDGLKHGYGKQVTLSGTTRGIWKEDELIKEYFSSEDQD